VCVCEANTGPMCSVLHYNSKVSIYDLFSMNLFLQLEHYGFRLFKKKTPSCAGTLSFTTCVCGGQPHSVFDVSEEAP